MAPPASSGDGESSSSAAEKEEKIEEIEAEKDPFAASDKLNQPAELVGGFKKTRDPSATDLTTALATLEVTTLPPAEATQSTRIAIEGSRESTAGSNSAARKPLSARLSRASATPGAADWTPRSSSAPRRLFGSRKGSAGSNFCIYYNSFCFSR